MTQILCGVDVSSTTLDAYVRPSGLLGRFPNNPGLAGRFEPDFIAFGKRLRDQGKPPKVVRIALAHKLLIRLNAKARDVRNTQTSTRAA